MPEGKAAAVKAQGEQRKIAKRATIEMFRDRKPHEAEFEFDLLGTGEKVSLLFRAVGSVEYDKLIDSCPPGKEQIAEGLAYDQVKFMPLLLSKVCADPVFTLQEWNEIFSSKGFGRGEISELFFSAVGVCNRQLGMAVVDPTGPASE